MCRAEVSVDLVIRCHHRPGIAVPDSNLERLEMDLTERAIWDLLIDEKAAVFLVIGCIMLDASGDASGLDGVDESTGELAGQKRVLAVSFEIAAS